MSDPISTLTAHGIYLPPAYAIHAKQPVTRCKVIVSVDGEVCGHPIFEGERPEQHIVPCARRHEEHIRAYRDRTHPEIMRAWDKDLEGWIGRHRQEILDGRKKLGGGVV